MSGWATTKSSVVVFPASISVAFGVREELPALLPDHAGLWVAYAGAQQLGFGKTKTELYQKLLAQGRKRGEFIVRCVEEAELDDEEHMATPFDADEF